MTMARMVGDAVSVAAYFVVGTVVLMACEGWTAVNSVYFLAMTVSTVGYGDISPTAPSGQWFMTGYCPLGIVLIFSTIARYAEVVQAALRRATEALLALCGWQVVNVMELDVASYSPEDVSRRLRYWRRFLIALSPSVVLLAGFVVGTRVLLNLT